MEYQQTKAYKKEPKRKTRSHRDHISLNHQDYCRLLLAFAVIAALIGKAINAPLMGNLSLSLASALLVYSFIAYYITKAHDKPNILIYLTLIDGIFLGLVIATLSYSPWPSLLLLSLSYFNTLYQGSIKYWLLLNVGLAIGVSIGIFILGQQALASSSHDWVNYPIAIGALLYLCIYSFFNRKQALKSQIKQDDLAAEIKQQKIRLYEISRFLPKSAWDQIEGKKKSKIERKPITIFFSDIVGFSSLTEELEAETLSNVLSSYLVEMSKIVEEFNGTIDKFIGDAIMVTFGDDETSSKGVKQDAIACASMALAMGQRMRELQEAWAEMGIKKPLQIRMGINSGYCTVGTFGTSKHLDHTALGVHVNLASRLESAGQAEEILISHETWSLINDTILCTDKGKIKAKGFTHPVQVYKVINHRSELGERQSYFSKTTDGFAMHLDLQKVNSYDREKVIESLELATKKLKDSLSK
jgi:class 3 adenylate cyclase